MSALVLGSVRSGIADYVAALLTVYIIIILAYVLLSWIQMFGGRIPYHRVLSAVIGFVNDAARPYLGLFRRILPSMGGMDFSPTIGIILLIVLARTVPPAIRG